MRLLNIYSLQFEDFSRETIPPYITTSHRWSNDETTYQDCRERKANSIGYRKLEQFCNFARKENEKGGKRYCEWIWLDTACIDKTSSAEVTESINSMFSWYRQSYYCIAYLADVRPLSAGMEAVMADFRRSEWFERGWTLQELLAPRSVVFLTQDWQMIGHKCSSGLSGPPCAACASGNNKVLNQELEVLTGVPGNILQNYEESKNLRPRDKWSWAAHRKTTKPEDMTYCLLGIFDVFLPLIYGEGADNASARLKQEIRKRNRRPSRQQSTSPFFEARKQQASTPFGPQFPFDAPPQFEGRRTNETYTRHHSPSKYPKPCRNQTVDLSDSDCEDRSHVGSDLTPNFAQRALVEEHLPYIDEAALSRLSPSQIAAAGDALPFLDLRLAASMSPAKIALVAMNTPGGRVSHANKSDKAGRLKEHIRRTRVR